MNHQGKKRAVLGPRRGISRKLFPFRAFSLSKYSLQGASSAPRRMVRVGVGEWRLSVASLLGRLPGARELRYLLRSQGSEGGGQRAWNALGLPSLRWAADSIL